MFTIVGYEYTVEATIGGYGAVEKTYHMCRRRRWVRNRKLDKDAAVLEEEVRRNNGFHFKFFKWLILVNLGETLYRSAVLYVHVW